MALLFLIAFLFAPGEDLAIKSKQAKEAMAAGQYEKAIALYSELNRAIPRNAGLMMNLGLAMHEAGRYSAALRQFQSLARMRPDLTPALLFIGLDYQKLKQPNKAIAPLSRVIAVDPANKTALLELADAYLAVGRSEEAAARFRELSDLDPKEPKAWQGLGLSHLALSRKAFEILEKTAPESPYWFAVAGRAKLEQRQPRAAFRLYREALARAPRLSIAHAGLADVYRYTGHDDWAALEESKAPDGASAQARPGTPEALYQQIAMYQAQARDAFTHLGQLPPTAESHELMGGAYRAQERNHESAEEYREALKLDTGSLKRELEKELAQSLWLDRDYAEAIPMLEHLLQAEPGSPELNHELGDSLVESGQPQKAIRYLERAVQAAPSWLPAKASLGRAYLHVDRYSNAAEQLKAALPLQENATYYQLAQAYRKLGRPEEARSALATFQRLSRSARERKEEIEEITPP
ncbi:MAG: tetratricopeptide repeat protein [Acidobacteriota bacterium]|nr:tetratricopeptide repeat protein [Acidobacteriota bacterium]